MSLVRDFGLDPYLIRTPAPDLSGTLLTPSTVEVYVNGIESDDSEFLGHQERIRSQFPQEFVCSRLDYELTDVEFDAQGKPIAVSRVSPITNAPPRAQFLLNLDSVDFQGQNSVQVKLILHWSPLASANAEIDAKNKAPHYRTNHPTDDHYLPLLFTLGSASSGEQVSYPVQGWEYGNLSRRSVLFG